MNRGAFHAGTGEYVGERLRCTAPHPPLGGVARVRYPCDTRLPVPNRTKVRRDPGGDIECPNPDCPARYSIEGDR